MPALKPRGSLLNAPDYAHRVNLIKKIKIDNAWRFASSSPKPTADSGQYTTHHPPDHNECLWTSAVSEVAQ